MKVEFRKQHHGVFTMAPCPISARRQFGQDTVLPIWQTLVHEWYLLLSRAALSQYHNYLM